MTERGLQGFANRIERDAAAEPKFDVLAVLIKDPHTVRFMGENLSERNAEAVQKMAVMRRGMSEEFYVLTAAGSYFEGECWLGKR